MMKFDYCDHCSNLDLDNDGDVHDLSATLKKIGNEEDELYKEDFEADDEDLLGLIPNLNMVKKNEEIIVGNYGKNYKLNMYKSSTRDNSIGKGTYGIIYNGRLVHKRDPDIYKDLALKLSLLPRRTKKRDYISDKAFFNEIFIHSFLYCNYKKHLRKNDLFLIPEIRMVGKTGLPTEPYMTGMEVMESPSNGLIFQLYTNELEDSFVWKLIGDLAKTLKHLYETSNFMHRDLHFGNIMYKKNRFYIIDFGQAQITIEGKDIYKTNLYTKMLRNKSFDMRIFMLSFYEQTKSHLSKSFKTFFEIYFSHFMYTWRILNSQRVKNNIPVKSLNTQYFFHNAYDLQDIQDTINNFDFIISMTESPDPFTYFVNFCYSFQIASSSPHFNSNHPHILTDSSAALLINNLVTSRHIKKEIINLPSL